MIETAIAWLVQTIGNSGYIGIFILMAIESSVFPLPSEVVIIPAGYLAYKGEMNYFLIVIAGTLGSLAGACFNYYLALKLGRTLLLKYGKYIFIRPHHLETVELFFRQHGEISTFSGRLLLGVRHFISLPAGLARMNIAKFSFYTILGSFIWVNILALLGYFIGENQELIERYLTFIIIFLIIAIIIIGVIYIWGKRLRASQDK
ncbi:MAG: DedA family protein [Campylobacteraceae bacterium]|jgi:membrane protein DedA with SNARE-associated domain|nr:DedA family protein [Campylobacteraceae bacterium]